MTGPGTGADNDLVRAPDLPGSGEDLIRAPGPSATGSEQPRQPGGVPDHQVRRAVIGALAGVAMAVLAVLLTRNGVRTDDFPPFLNGTSATPITRYSGPWLTAGAAAALVAALLLLLTVIDLVRRRRTRGANGAPNDPAQSTQDVIGPTPP